jgi:Arc/MetJ-type ribon-helix-helix transcriptional regulator
MSTHIAMTIDERLVEELDVLVGQGAFVSRSAAVEDALRRRLIKSNRRRLARECAKLDPVEEQARAEVGMAEDVETWPEY